MKKFFITLIAVACIGTVGYSPKSKASFLASCIMPEVFCGVTLAAMAGMAVYGYIQYRNSPEYALNCPEFKIPSGANGDFVSVNCETKQVISRYMDAVKYQPAYLKKLALDDRLDLEYRNVPSLLEAYAKFYAEHPEMIDGDPRNLIVDDEFDANSTNVPDVYQYLAKNHFENAARSIQQTIDYCTENKEFCQAEFARLNLDSSRPLLNLVANR